MKINYKLYAPASHRNSRLLLIALFLTLQQTSYETLNEVFRGLPQYLQINAVTEP
jgi:hypothetical protein